MPPKVSVIIPTYNNEKYIKAAVDSASRQTYRDLEVIVLNDGSTESTLDIVSQAALTDPRIRVITRPHSGKPSIARNAGIRIAQASTSASWMGMISSIRRRFEIVCTSLRATPVSSSCFTICGICTRQAERNVNPIFNEPVQPEPT